MTIGREPTPRSGGGRRVFLDVGGHIGETLAAAMDPRWRFDRIWSFEPTSACQEALQALADKRVVVVPAGLWSSDTMMDIHDPGTLHASVDASASRHGVTESCTFIDAATWFAENLEPTDRVWMKVNVEAAEVEVLGRLLDTGSLETVEHLVVHFDVEKVGRQDEANSMRARLDHSGVTWAEADAVMFGRDATQKTRSWLDWTEGHRIAWRRARLEHRARRLVFLARRRLGLLPRPR